MGLSTPILGGLKDGFFGPKITKNGMFLAHPYDPGMDPDFLAKNDPKITGGTRRNLMTYGLSLFIIVISYFHKLFFVLW